MILDASSTEFFFYKLIQSSRKHTKYNIKDSAESYLVFMLSSVARGEIDLGEPLFSLLEKGVESPHPRNFMEFKKLGDSSLISLGIFPENIKKRGISKDYVRNMGKVGYIRASETVPGNSDTKELYESLADSFESLEKIIRRVGGLAPLGVDGS